MNICMNGIETRYITLAAASALEAGDLAKVSAANTAGPAGASEDFIGPVAAVREGLASVQTHGYCRLSYTGSAAPTLGWCKLAADGAGGVTTGSGREHLVVEVDAKNKAVGLFL